MTNATYVQEKIPQSYLFVGFARRWTLSSNFAERRRGRPVGRDKTRAPTNESNEIATLAAVMPGRDKKRGGHCHGAWGCFDIGNCMYDTNPWEIKAYLVSSQWIINAGWTFGLEFFIASVIGWSGRCICKAIVTRMPYFWPGLYRVSYCNRRNLWVEYLFSAWRV